MANKRALIVDDSTTAQYRLKKMLKAYALDIDVADSGEAALRYLANNAPDVVFMDHTMPGMDGLRALQVIKSHPETAVIPVIMYTSQSGDVYTGQARALGALDVVSKDTINATDLSKVMEAIHIYPLDQQEKMEAAAQAKKANNVTDLEAHRIERRAPSAAAAEQARNLELRLGHLEHTLEDNRRFITARVLKELQGLRQNLRQEFSNIQQQKQPPAPTVTEEVDADEEESGSSFNLFKFIFIVILLVIAFFLIQISNQLSENTEVQTLLGNQLQQVANKENRSITVSNPRKNSVIAKNDYLTDLAWTFNQNALLAFNQNSLDPKPILRLNDLLNRISTTGFKGSALITISVGNFCNSIDNMGVAHLAKPNINAHECVFSNELYTIERVMEEYSHEANLLLNNLMRDRKGILSITINTQEGTDTYPELSAQLTAREWNQVAQNNNRIDLVLLPDSE
jgi:CheY-like chemotaxis protein